MTDTPREPGYRGSLPPMRDRLAKPWVAMTFVIVILIFGLAFLDVPTRFFPQPTVSPTPTASPTPSADPSASAEPSGSVEASVEASATAEPTATPEPSVSPSATP